MNLNPYSDQSTKPAAHAEAVTPSDDDDLPNPSRGLYIGSGGSLRITTVNDEEVDFAGLAAGQVYPFQAKKVHIAGTSASSIVALF